MVKWRRKAKQNTISVSKLSLPVFKRDAKEKTKKNHDNNLDIATAEVNRQSAFGVMLHSIIQSTKTIPNLNKSEKETQKEKQKIANALKKKKNELMKSKRVPRGTWDLADKLGKVPRGTTKRTLRNTSNSEK